MEVRQASPAAALLGLANICQRAAAATAYRISPRIAPTKRKRPGRRSSILDSEVKNLWRLSRATRVDHGDHGGNTAKAPRLMSD